MEKSHFQHLADLSKSLDSHVKVSCLILYTNNSTSVPKKGVKTYKERRLALHKPSYHKLSSAKNSIKVLVHLKGEPQQQRTAYFLILLSTWSGAAWHLVGWHNTQFTDQNTMRKQSSLLGSSDQTAHNAHFQHCRTKCWANPLFKPTIKPLYENICTYSENYRNNRRKTYIKRENVVKMQDHN